MVEIDRSRVLTWQRCPRERWLAYHAGPNGKGLQRRAKALPLVAGSAFHEGAELLLHNDIEGAVTRAINFLNEAFKGKGVGLDGEEVTDQSLLYSAQEQMALSEGLIRAWGLEKLPEFLQTFEVLEVEAEGRAILKHGAKYTHLRNVPVENNPEVDSVDYYSVSGNDPEIVLLFRPDALVRERLSGDHYIVSWKTASMYSKRSLMQAKTDMQSMSEMFGVEQTKGIKVEGILYLYAVKGKRSLDDWDQLFKQGTHLIYAWKNAKPKSDDDEMWSWSYKWTDETGGHSLGKGWKKVPVWAEYPGGVKAWIEDLHNRSIFPRHVDPFESVFPQSLPVERRADEVQHWLVQTVEQETEVARKVELMRRQGAEAWPSQYLDRLFPQYTHSCNSYSGCQFIDICHNGVPAEEGELYQIRNANHPETGDEDE